MSAEDRRRLGAVSALVAGVFFGLCLVPAVPTGAVGRALGTGLWRLLGAGAVGLPLLGLALALAGFDRLPRLDMKRAAILLGGLAVIVPMTIGVIVLARPTDFDPPLADWTVAARATGLVPGLIAYGITGLVGQTGGLLLGFLLLSTLTILTLAWHPLRRLERRTAGEAVPAPATAAAVRSARTPVPEAAAGDEEEDEAEPAEREAAPARRKAPRPPKPAKQGVVTPGPTGAEDELPPVELLRLPPPVDVTADQAALDKLGQSLIDTL
jgi:hypothetical protein